MLRHYEREVRFYLELASTVDMRVPRLPITATGPPTTNDVRRCVLEDMAPATQGDQLTGCTLEQADVAVRELAKLHGPRWDDPTLYDIDWIEHDRGATGVGDGLRDDVEMFFPGFAGDLPVAISAPTSSSWPSGSVGDRCVAQRPRRPEVDHWSRATIASTTCSSRPPRVARRSPSSTGRSPAHGSPITDLSYFIGAGLLPPRTAGPTSASSSPPMPEALGAYGVELDDAWVWEQYRREAFAGLIVAAMASQIVTLNDRSEAMFGAMANRHLRHALDLDSLSPRSRPLHQGSDPRCKTGGMELPDFHIPHAEKIEWMIETTGWALEPVAADVERNRPRPATPTRSGCPQRSASPRSPCSG